MNLLKSIFARESHTSADYAKVQGGGKAFAQKHAEELRFLQNARRFSGLPELSLGNCSDDKEFGKLIRAAIVETGTKLVSDLREKKACDDGTGLAFINGQIHDLRLEEQDCVQSVNILRSILGYLDAFGM